MLKAILEQRRLLGVDTFAVNLRDARTLDLKNYDLDLIGFFPTIKYRKLDSILRITGGYKCFSLKGRKVYSEDQIGLLLDASGFAFSDKWGAGICQLYAKHFRSIKSSGGKIVLMPQALGPFKKQDVKHSFTEMVSYVDLLFVRDKISLEYLEDIEFCREKVKQAPDFTNLIDAGPHQFSQIDVIVVPNMRVVDKGRQISRKNYIEYWQSIISWLKENKFSTLIMNHEGKEDALICDEIAQRFNDVPIFYSDDPLIVKSRINACRLVIGARFHSLVSALSQTIPVIANGWSHKYSQLLIDYNHIDYLDQNTDADFVIQCADKLLRNDENHKHLIQNIKTHSATQKEKTLLMWNEVRKILS